LTLAWTAPMQKLAKLACAAFFAILALLAGPSASKAQQPNLIPRLCFLTLEPGTLQTRSPRFDAFFQTLRELGYVDGQSIVIDYMSAADDSERFPDLVAECLGRKADIIVPSTTPAAKASKNATSIIPIVMIALGDPVGTGLVDILARPGGNITGMSQMVSELAAKRLELLKDAVPKISRVLVLTYLVSPIASLQVKAMKAAAQSLGIALQVRDIQGESDIAPAFDAAAKEGADGLIVTAESMFVTYRARVSELAAQHKLPAMYPYTIQVVDAGGLMAYDIVSADLHRRAAGYVDRILKGARPSDLPVQQRTKFELVVNLKAAEAIGLIVPSAFLDLADKVIE
jgi:putative ABC transport system substrate-binding protein